MHSCEKDGSNIEYHVGLNRTQDAIFRVNVTSDLLTVGYTVSDLPHTVEKKVEVLRTYLKDARQIRINPNALTVAEDASLHTQLAPDQCPPCILHLNNRIIEMLVQQIILVGMRFNQIVERWMNL